MERTLSPIKKLGYTKIVHSFVPRINYRTGQPVQIEKAVFNKSPCDKNNTLKNYLKYGYKYSEARKKEIREMLMLGRNSVKKTVIQDFVIPKESTLYKFLSFHY